MGRHLEKWGHGCMSPDPRLSNIPVLTRPSSWPSSARFIPTTVPLPYSLRLNLLDVYCLLPTARDTIAVTWLPTTESIAPLAIRNLLIMTRHCSTNQTAKGRHQMGEMQHQPHHSPQNESVRILHMHLPLPTMLPAHQQWRPLRRPE